MSIWEYSAGWKHESDKEMWNLASCIYCSSPLARDQEDEEKASMYEEMNYGFSDNFSTRAAAVIGVCPACGWWKYGIVKTLPDVLRSGAGPKSYYEIRRGILKSLDLASADNPANEVRDYLTARFESRFQVHPRVFEEVVGSVFRDHGYRVRVTAYSGDDGIDVILDGDAGTTIGVQVKRYKERISVAQIRELTGALVIGGHTKGIFVTTSEFQSGAERTANLSQIRGFPIELMDAEKFYDALKIAQLSSIREISAKKPWGNVPEWKFG
jgi:restriction system protein